MRKNNLAEILARYLRGECTQEEAARIDEWFAAHGAEKNSLEQMDPAEREAWATALFSDIRTTNLKNEPKAPKPVKQIRYWPRVAAAAAAIVSGLLIGVYVYTYEQSAPDAAQSVAIQDIPPGGNKATLTLADGRTIALDRAQEGELAEDAGARVMKLDSGSLAYSGSGSAEETGYNMLSTPRGGQFKVILPDGTGVWLNAASSVTYPTVFSKAERRIVLTGEAYFEVAPDASRPFKVHTATADGKGQVVEVLGTHFNISAYPDEPAVKTTLLQGSVLVKAESQTMPNKKQETKNQKLLKPGQQSVLKGDVLSVHGVNTADVVAWKNGLFQFRDASLETVMRQLARWYDVEVVYEGEIPERSFSGKIYQHINASQALELLRFTKVNFSIEAPEAGGQGKRIIVSP